MSKQLRILRLEELTDLQQTVVRELLRPEWQWRSEDALLDAIEDRRKELNKLIADNSAMILDREESAKKVFFVLNRMKLLQTQKQMMYWDGELTEKTWYAIAPNFINNKK